MSFPPFFRSGLLQIEFGLCGKTERDIGEQKGGRGGGGGGGGAAKEEADEPACVENMCLCSCTARLGGEERGVCLAATPKDCHKPINSPPTPILLS